MRHTLARDSPKRSVPPHPPRQEQLVQCRRIVLTYYGIRTYPIVDSFERELLGGHPGSYDCRVSHILHWKLKKPWRDTGGVPVQTTS